MLPINAIGGLVGALFERAFHPDGRSRVPPTPEAWIDALDSLKAALEPRKSIAHNQHLATAGRP